MSSLVQQPDAEVSARLGVSTKLKMFVRDALRGYHNVHLMRWPVIENEGWMGGEARRGGVAGRTVCVRPTTTAFDPTSMTLRGSAPASSQIFKVPHGVALDAMYITCGSEAEPRRGLEGDSGPHPAPGGWRPPAVAARLHDT